MTNCIRYFTDTVKKLQATAKKDIKELQFQYKIYNDKLENKIVETFHQILDIKKGLTALIHENFLMIGERFT